MNITRRDFLKWTGAAGLSTVLAPILDRDIKAFAQLPPGEGYFLPTKSQYSMCKTCDSNCGVILRIVDGVIREINGNPKDELGGQGKICVKGQSAIRNIYDPDIIKTPLMRTNTNKGIGEDPGFVAISWTEALNTIAEKMVAAKTSYGAKSIVVLDRPPETQRHFVDSLGTPNQVCHVDTCYLDQDVCWKATTGKIKSRTFETEKATYILCFGYDMPGKSKMAQLRSFLTAWKRGAKIVVFDPRLSVTANFADEWFQIKPGTDLAVVLAMIHVIINENLYDATYVDNYCSGFTELKNHINTQGYTPEWAEGISGIPANTIRRIAREFASSEHSLIPTYKRDPAGPVYANSFQLGRALLILKALVGGIESEGGDWFPRVPGTPPSLVIYAPELTQYPQVDGFDPIPNTYKRVDGQHLFPYVNTLFGQSNGSQTGYKSKGNFSHLADGLRRSRMGEKFPDGTDSYPVKVIFSNQYNVLSFPGPDKPGPDNDLIDELCNPDIFIVATDNVISCMCWFADIVLPVTWWPEDGKDGSSFGTTEQHSIWERLYLIDGVGPVLPDRWGLGKIYKELLNKLHELGYWSDLGNPNFNIDFGALTKERMKQFAIDKGIGDYNGDSTVDWKDLRDYLRDNGGIWQDKKAPTCTLKPGQIKLYSSSLATAGHTPLPVWCEKLSHPSSDDEFYLVTNHNPYHRMNKNSNDPLIMDLQPENYLYIHPSVAAKFEVVTGDYVRVKNPIIDKELVIRVKVIEGIRSDTVMTEHGYGHFSTYLHVANNKGVYDGDLEPSRTLTESLERFYYNAGMCAGIGDTVVKILGKA